MMMDVKYLAQFTINGGYIPAQITYMCLILFMLTKAVRGTFKNESCRSPCAVIEHHAMKTYWRSGGIVPRILELVTR
jgi:hypothetical protein